MASLLLFSPAEPPETAVHQHGEGQCRNRSVPGARSPWNRRILKPRIARENGRKPSGQPSTGPKAAPISLSPRAECPGGDYGTLRRQNGKIAILVASTSPAACQPAPCVPVRVAKHRFAILVQDKGGAAVQDPLFRSGKKLIQAEDVAEQDEGAGYAKEGCDPIGMQNSVEHGTLQVSRRR